MDTKNKIFYSSKVHQSDEKMVDRNRAEISGHELRMLLSGMLAEPWREDYTRGGFSEWSGD